MDTASGTAASDGSFAATVVEYLDAGFLSVLLSKLADGIVVAAVGCTEGVQLPGSAQSRIPVGIEDYDLAV